MDDVLNAPMKVQKKAYKLDDKELGIESASDQTSGLSYVPTCKAAKDVESDWDTLWKLSLCVLVSPVLSDAF